MQTICGLDPGTRYLGWAIVQSARSDEPRLIDHGTWIPKGTLRGIERQLWLLSKLKDLLDTWRPDFLAYEEFTWRSRDDEGDRYVTGRPGIERLIGGIQAMTLFPPFPVLMGLLPSKWGQQLVGQRSHTKAQVAFCVNARVGTLFKGDHYDNHVCDAVGIALVARDLLTLEAVIRQRATPPA